MYYTNYESRNVTEALVSFQPEKDFGSFDISNNENISKNETLEKDFRAVLDLINANKKCRNIIPKYQSRFESLKQYSHNNKIDKAFLMSARFAIMTLMTEGAQNSTFDIFEKNRLFEILSRIDKMIRSQSSGINHLRNFADLNLKTPNL